MRSSRWYLLAALFAPVLDGGGAPGAEDAGADGPPAVAAPTSVAAPSSAVAPSPYDSDDALPPHAEPVADYTMRASLQVDAHTVHGEGTIRWRNASRVPAREIWVHLYLNAFKNQNSAFFRDPVGTGRGIETPKTWGTIDVRKFVLREGPEGAPVDVWTQAQVSRPGDADETDARVPLPREIMPGEVVTFDMTWDDKLPSIVERTGFDGSFHLVGQWFPKIARLEPDGTWAHFPFHHLSEFYADYGTYDVTLDVPASYVVGATGPTVEAHLEGDRRVERHVQGDIHDFAFGAWDKFQTLGDTIDGVSVNVLYPPGFRVAALREIAALRYALPHFRTRYGRYPYPTLTVIHPPGSAREAGGMEYPTLITTGGHWSGPPGVLTTEAVTVHEFGHQYFYGLIGSNESAWPFLDEGLNQFAQGEAMAAWRGAGSIVDLAGLEISEQAAESVWSNRMAHEEPVAQPAREFDDGASYGALVYGRTSAVLETLRRVHGDAPFFHALGRYARRQRFQHPGPAELLASVDEVLGSGARENLRRALFERGWVDYVLTDMSSLPAMVPAGIFDKEGKRETVATGTPTDRQSGWVLVTRRGTLTFPVDIELTLADGTTQRARWSGEGDSVRIPYAGTAKLVSAVVDPDERVLLDGDRRNNHLSIGRPGSTTRTWERLLYWFELAAQAVAP